jgi:hypothetical protein
VSLKIKSSIRYAELSTGNTGHLAAKCTKREISMPFRHFQKVNLPSEQTNSRFGSEHSPCANFFAYMMGMRSLGSFVTGRKHPQ